MLGVASVRWKRPMMKARIVPFVVVTMDGMR